MKIEYKLELLISGSTREAVAEMAARGKGEGEILRKWEQGIRTTKFGGGKAAAKVVSFEEVS